MYNIIVIYYLKVYKQGDVKNSIYIVSTVKKYVYRIPNQSQYEKGLIFKRSEKKS